MPNYLRSPHHSSLVGVLTGISCFHRWRRSSVSGLAIFVALASGCFDDSGTSRNGDGDGVGDGDGDGGGDGDGDGSGDGDGDGDGSCSPGSLGCECDGGECEDGLECVANSCIEDPCPDGTEGCECSDQWLPGCNEGLDCVNGYCVDQSAECLGPGEACYDNDEGTLGDCCDTLGCLGSEAANDWVCTPQCFTHSECAQQCCRPLDDLSGPNFCADSIFECEDGGYCIDTCMTKNDGVCDDGGPGSEHAICELGTDCTDCGIRY